MKTLLRDVLVTVIVTIIFFLLLQATVQVSVVVGSSMEPSLHDGQRLLVNKAAYFFNEPEGGDIIVFHPPNNPRAAPYIKRVIGLPGNTVEIKGGIVYVNDSPRDEPYTKPPNYTFPQKKIPEDNYFVLGDNRNNSNDSHNDWTVPRQNIIGKAWLSIWPPREWGLAPKYSLP